MQNLGGKQGINVPMANSYAKKQLSVKYFVFGFIHSVILQQQHLMAVLKINPVAISDFRLDQKLEHLNPRPIFMLSLHNKQREVVSNGWSFLDIFLVNKNF